MGHSGITDSYQQSDGISADAYIARLRTIDAPAAHIIGNHALAWRVRDELPNILIAHREWVAARPGGWGDDNDPENLRYHYGSIARYVRAQAKAPQDSSHEWRLPPGTVIQFLNEPSPFNPDVVTAVNEAVAELLAINSGERAEQGIPKPPVPFRLGLLGVHMGGPPNRIWLADADPSDPGNQDVEDHLGLWTPILDLLDTYPDVLVLFVHEYAFRSWKFVGELPDGTPANFNPLDGEYWLIGRVIGQLLRLLRERGRVNPATNYPNWKVWISETSHDWDHDDFKGHRTVFGATGDNPDGQRAWAREMVEMDYYVYREHRSWVQTQCIFVYSTNFAHRGFWTFDLDVAYGAFAEYAATGQVGDGPPPEEFVPDATLVLDQDRNERSAPQVVPATLIQLLPAGPYRIRILEEGIETADGFTWIRYQRGDDRNRFLAIENTDGTAIGQVIRDTDEELAARVAVLEAKVNEQDERITALVAAHAAATFRIAALEEWQQAIREA